MDQQNKQKVIESLKTQFRFLEQCWESCSILEQKEQIAGSMTTINTNIKAIKNE